MFASAVFRYIRGETEGSYGKKANDQNLRDILIPLVVSFDLYFFFMNVFAGWRSNIQGPWIVFVSAGEGILIATYSYYKM
jgi:hypothetical protein